MKLFYSLVILTFGFGLSIHAMELDKARNKKLEKKLLKKTKKYAGKLKSKALSDGRPHSKCYAVTPFLFVGKYPRVKTVQSYLDTGITYFLDLTEKSGKVNYINFFKEIALKQDKAFEYVQIPMNENTTTSSMLINQILDTIDSALACGHKVYVHADNVESQATELVASCYLIRHSIKTTGTEAINHVAQLELSLGKKNKSTDHHLIKSEERQIFFTNYIQNIAGKDIKIKADKLEAALPPHDQSYMVEAGLFAGNYPNKEDLQKYLDTEITLFLDLTEDGERVPYAQLFKEEAAQQGKVVEHIRKPIKDHHVPTVDFMKDIIDTINTALSQGHKIYVHCHAGIGRTGTVIICYLMGYGMKLIEALYHLEQLRNTRPCCQYTLSLNKEQKDFIQSFQ